MSTNETGPAPIGMGTRDAIRFEEELPEVADASTADVAGGNLITGRITRCGQPAAGIRIEAIGILTIGLEIDSRPCVKSTSTRALGSATTTADGTYSISYSPSPADVDFCAYSARVRATVVESGGTVWHSPETTERPSVRIDHELYPDCPGGESAVLVIDGTGRPVANADVFHDGRLVGRTNAQGTVSIASLAIGDRLVARRLLKEHRTDRNGHSEGSTADWSHRSYNTSLRVRHDSNGDNVELRPFIVADPTAVQRLQVSSFNTLIGFNLLVSIEWDATADEIRRYTDRILEMSELLYNCTDGQFLVERVTVVDNRRYWDDADIRIYANLNQRSQADVGAIFSSGGRIHMNPNDAHEPSVTLHELGHYAFNVYDEYKAGSGWEESDGPPICTFASESDGTDYSAGGSKDSCLMRGARNAEIKKMCSTNAANPHATTTRQGAKDCWSEIIENYGDRYWRLRTPSTSGAIIDVFPDSGVPLATSTSPPAGVGTVASYIPIEDWKPIRRTSSVTRADECPDRLVRVELDGSPRDDVKVSLESAAVTTYQGVTKEYDLAYNVSSGPGEIRIRGAHVGDRVTAIARIDGSGALPDILLGSVDVEDCGPSALILAVRRIDLPFLVRLDPIGPGEARVLVDATGPAARPAIARVRVGGGDPIAIAIPSAARAEDAALRGRLFGLPERDIADVEIGVIDDEGREVVVRTTSSFASLREDDALDVTSADGRLELSLPTGALEAPAAIVIETAVGLPPPSDRFAIVGDAYRIASSRDDPLAVDAMLDFNLDVDANGTVRDRTEPFDPTVVRLTDDGRGWDNVQVQQHSKRFVSARIDRLGTYALVTLVERDQPEHR